MVKKEDEGDEDERETKRRREKAEHRGERLEVPLETRSYVPARELQVHVEQCTWEHLSTSARLKVLKESLSRKQDLCLRCAQEGRRQFFCKLSLQPGWRLSKMTDQHPYQGNDPRTMVFCSSCYFHNSMKVIRKSGKFDSSQGWYPHSRPTCLPRPDSEFAVWQTTSCGSACRTLESCQTLRGLLT